MGSENSLYKDVLSVTSDYFGPAAGRFIDRQIQNHLKKSPAQLNRKDLNHLISWISAAMAVLTDDLALRTEYTERLKDLADD